MGLKDHVHTHVKNTGAQGKARGSAPVAQSGREPLLWDGHGESRDSESWLLEGLEAWCKWSLEPRGFPVGSMSPQVPLGWPWNREQSQPLPCQGTGFDNTQ